MLRVLLPAIKTGRYTHAKRAKDISEVKNLGTKMEITDVEPETVTPAMVLDTSTEHGQIIQVLTAAYIGSTVYTPEYISSLPAREEKYMVRDTLLWRHMNVIESQISTNRTVPLTSLPGQQLRKRWKIRITGPLWRESTDERWIPITKGSNVESVSMSWRHCDQARLHCKYLWWVSAFRDIF